MSSMIEVFPVPRAPIKTLRPAANSMSSPSRNPSSIWSRSISNFAFQLGSCGVCEVGALKSDASRRHPSVGAMDEPLCLLPSRMLV